MSNDSPKKKINLQEAIRQQLENKKKQSTAGKPMNHLNQSTKKMKSQQTKKQNNQKRRTGV
jgi:hypothetical protein